MCWYQQVIDRYDVSGLTEAQFQPGSNELVLKNLLGITSPEEMDQVEAKALVIAMDALIQEYDEEHRFTAGDLFHMHKLWLGDVYEWAGELRQINLSKGGFPFATANRLEQLIRQFELRQLAKYTPCVGMDKSTVVKALSEVHVEFELIHPFREGNGRVGRILITLMALQAGLPLLNYDLFVAERKAQYFAAIQDGMERNYHSMEALFIKVIENSLVS
jgi:cell filamentation protein